MRNVAGELEGAMAAMTYCEEHEIPLLHLYYDYQGIESWATGEWKRNKPGTVRYKQYFDSLKKVRVVFHKVKGHSGVKNSMRQWIFWQKQRLEFVRTLGK